MDCDNEVTAPCGSDIGPCNRSHINGDLSHEKKTSEKLLESAEIECASLKQCINVEAEAMKDDVPQTQLSPPAKSNDEECILIEDSPPISGTESAKSKRGTGRKGAFAGVGSKRAGASSKSTSPETNGKSQDGMKRFLNMVRAKSRNKLRFDCS